MPDSFDWDQLKSKCKDVFFALRDVIECIQREEAAYSMDEKTVHRADMVKHLKPLGIVSIELPAKEQQDTLETERERIAPRSVEDAIDEPVEPPRESTKLRN